MASKCNDDYHAIIDCRNAPGRANWRNNDDLKALMEAWYENHLKGQADVKPLVPLVISLAQIAWFFRFLELCSRFGDAIFDKDYDRRLRLECNFIIELINQGFPDRAGKQLEFLFNQDADVLPYQAHCTDVMKHIRDLAIDLDCRSVLPIIDRSFSTQRVLQNPYDTNVFGEIPLKLYSGRQIKFISNNNCFVCDEIQASGTYEGTSIEAWEALSRHNDVVLDIGSNVGIYSLVAGVGNPDKAVHAFEANPTVIPSLTQNVDTNDAKNITVHNLAVSATNGRAKFLHHSSVSNDLAGQLATNLPKGAKTNRDTIDIEMVAIDSFLPPQTDRSLLVKVDTEGGELDCILGMQEWLAIGPHDFLIESFSDNNCEKLTALFSQYGYRFYRISEGDHRLEEGQSLRPAVFDHRHSFNQLITQKSTKELRGILPDHCEIIGMK